MKSMRKISPFISAMLMVLVLTCSTGFIVTMHTCYHCGMQNLVTSPAVAGTDDKCCCEHDMDVESAGHNMGEYVFSHDCCSLVTEEMIAVQVIRTEVQPEIISFSHVAASQTIIPENDLRSVRLFPDNLQMHDGRGLITMHCQILS